MRRKLDEIDKAFLLKNCDNFTIPQLSKKLNLTEASITTFLKENTPEQHIDQIKKDDDTTKDRGYFVLDEAKSQRGDVYTKSVSTNWPDRIHRIKK